MSYNRAKGFSLLELLMVVALIGLLLAGMYNVFDGWAQRAVNRTAASDMLRVQSAAEDYVLANFDTFAADPINVFTEIDINDLRTFNYLPAGYVARNAFKQDIRVFKRTRRVNKLNRDGSNARDAANNLIFIFTIEVVTVSDNQGATVIRVPNKRLLDTAQAGGPRMGVIGNMVLAGTTFNNRATSLLSEWVVPLTGAAGLQAAGYAATPTALAGYLAAYGRVSAEKNEPNDAWLYRLSIDGRPELNRMNADLLMNNNPIQSVGTMYADKVNVTGNAVMRGTAQGVAADTAQAMTVEQAMQINSNTESRVNMKAGTGACTFQTVGNNRRISGGACTITGGEVQVISGASNANATIGALTTDGSVITDITNVTNTTDSRGTSTFTNFRTLDTMVASNQVIAPTTTVTGNLVETDEMQTGNMTVAGNSTVLETLTAARVRPGNGHSVTTWLMDIANAATFNQQLRANAVTATDSLYMNNVNTPTTHGTSTTYRDAQMGNRLIRCTRHSNDRVYCEPTGSYTWPNGVTETCSVPAWPSTGYVCNYSTAAVFLGTCTFTRNVGTSGQAYHEVGCI